MIGDPSTSSSLAEGESETAHLIALCSLPGLGPATLLRCHQGLGAAAAWAAIVAGNLRRVPELAPLLARMPELVRTRLVAAAQLIDPSEVLARHRAGALEVLVLGDERYPARLANDPAAPALLFASGRLAALDAPSVAIVGTRNATRLGLEFASRLGSELSDAGVSVVSGLALGIDGAAHRGALGDCGSGHVGQVSQPPEELSLEDAISGRPVGVIASGLDITYPRRHAALHAQVANAGLLLSETPLGVRPTAWRFPARNRIIAGLSDAVVVVESRSAGGSMLTAGEALERGVPVLAVPGHPAAPAASGANDLIFDGAGIVRSVEDVLEVIGISRPVPEVHRLSAERFGREHRLVLEVIGQLPAALPEIVERSGLSLEEASEVLVHLELSGTVVRSAGWFQRSSGHAGAPRGRVR